MRSGYLLSGVYLWFIDLDSKDLLADLFEKNFTLLNAPIVSTSKGFHIYCTWTCEVKTAHLSQIDVIANGYVVCPPSIHPSGKPDRFIRPLNCRPPLVDLETLGFAHISTPPPIIAKSVVQVPLNPSFDPSTNNSSNITVRESFDPLYCANQFAGVSLGMRHSTLVYIIDIEIANQFREEDALIISLVWNEKNKPSMTQAEVVKTVRDCYERYDGFDVKRDLKGE